MTYLAKMISKSCLSLYYFLGVAIICIMHLPVSEATIFIISEISNSTVMVMNDLPAGFIAERFPYFAIEVSLVQFVYII